MRPFLERLDRNAERWLLLVLYSFIVYVIFIEVVRRFVLLYSSIWGEETARFAFIFLVWIGASAAVRERAHSGTSTLRSGSAAAAEDGSGKRRPKAPRASRRGPRPRRPPFARRSGLREGGCAPSARAGRFLPPAASRVACGVWHCGATRSRLAAKIDPKAPRGEMGQKAYPFGSG